MGGYWKQFTNLLHSNASINDVVNGARKIVDKRIAKSKHLAKEYPVGYNLDGSSRISDWDRLKSLYTHSDGSTNYGMWAGTIAGGYMGVSAAGRIASGGGLYRDSDGNFDLMGIPFI